jgi:hypothetical protein
VSPAYNAAIAKGDAAMEEESTGYSDLFYVMLILGIIGLVGFALVAAGAGA